MLNKVPEDYRLYLSVGLHIVKNLARQRTIFAFFVGDMLYL
jgi:hypothetical protein